MARFLIDANLPYRFALWHGEDFLHVCDLGDDMPDAAIWQYAKEHDLIIVSKDADFSDWIMLSDPPPKVIHLRIGNMRLRDFSCSCSTFGHNSPNSAPRTNLSSCMKH